MIARDEWELVPAYDPRLDRLRDKFRHWLDLRPDAEARAECLRALRACRGVDRDAIRRTLSSMAFDDREQRIADEFTTYFDRA